MSKLYFKYGAMGCAKTVQAIICRHNYIKKGFKVLLVKPSIDTRSDFVESRIGLKAECENISPNDTFENLIKGRSFDVIIVDEAQFLSAKQIEELKDLTEKMPVICYGLLTNFKTKLFEGSKRLVELADSLSEIKSVCRCGRKATVNARFVNGKIVTDGPDVFIGADESYEAMCYSCFKKLSK